MILASSNTNGLNVSTSIQRDLKTTYDVNLGHWLREGGWDSFRYLHPHSQGFTPEGLGHAAVAAFPDLGDLLEFTVELQEAGVSHWRFHP